MKEIRILCSKAVFDHDNLIHLESVEFGIHSGDPFEICPAIVLEKAPHGSLDDFLKNKSLTWETKKALCHDIASGLDQLHRHGVLHGDLKPSHVLIFDHPERQYMAKLTGYGDSRIISKMSSADELAFGGTMPFRAPEIEEGSATFGQAWKTDIFSIGLLFWSIFVNRDFF
ncbi:kinase-like domain-containing protein, partial [Hyaloscypha finlandica]